MVIMVLFLSLLLLASSEVINLSDGKTELVDTGDSMGSSKLFKFYLDSIGSKDLVISLTTYSDFSDPDMFVSVNQEPTMDNFEYSSLSWGSGSIVITPSELVAKSNYNILVVCLTICRYGLTVSYTKEVLLQEGVPITAELTTGKQAIYQFLTSNAPSDVLTFTISQVVGSVEVYANTGEREPTSDNTLPVTRVWTGGFEVKVMNPPKITVYRVAVMALEPVSFTILVKNSNVKASLIQASVPTSGEVNTEEFAYYYINVDNAKDSLDISLTMFSGDGDIYVRAGALPTLTKYNFSSVHMGNENLVITGSERARIGSPTGVYYIGIYGYLHAAYTLLVTTTNTSFVALQSGTPQSGSVSLNEIQYYYLDYPSTNTNITFYLTTTSGNPDLYVKKCSYNLTSCYFNSTEINEFKGVWHSTHSSGNENIDIYHDKNSCSRHKTCYYVIGVKGVAVYSTFSLLALISSSSETVLREGRPQFLTLNEAGQKYFKYSVINDTVNEVTFMLTPIYGDADIYSAFNVPVDFTTYDKSSIKVGIEIDQVTYTRGVDLPSLVGTYYMMVKSAEACSFSIVAKEKVPGKNTTIQLYPGHPQKDTIYNFTDMDYRIYFFPLHYTQETKQPITITLTAITGSFNLYVANQISNLDWNNEIFYYNWASTNKDSSDPTNIISIKTTDVFYKPESTYLILVMGAGYMADKSATYMINFATGDGTVILSEDIPFTGVILEEDYDYFVFPIHYRHEDVTISLNVLSGDADLFISVNPANTHPTHDNHDFKSMMFGSDIITLVWENGLREKCPQLPDTYEFGDKTTCFMYVGVFGYQTSTYVIRVHPSKNLPSLQALGQPVSGVLNTTEYKFYYTYIDSNNDFFSTLQPVYGDSDLFINVYDKNSAGSDITLWERPSKDKSMYSSRSTVMSDEIDLLKSEIAVICPSKSCVLVAGVYCFSEVCSYTLTMRQNQITELIENKATYGSTDENFIYYSYYCDKDSTDFLVSITPLNDGNPDLYISKGSSKRPTETDFDWNSISWGGDSILITSSDPKFSGSETMKGTYIIAVKGSWGTVSFSLLVNNHPLPVFKLNSGLPQQGNLADNTFAYFQFSNYIFVDMLITITPVIGIGEFFANVYYEYYEDIYNKLPDENNYIWNSNSSNDRYTLSIPTTDNNFCVYCSIIIGVRAKVNPFQFSILAQNKLDFTVLQNGVPSKTEALAKKSIFYSFEVLRRTDFAISLTTYSGRPDIHVSTYKNMTWETFMWEAFYVENTLVLRVLQTDPNFKIGTYYIMVSTYENSMFSIIAHTLSSPITLVDGWPATYKLSSSDDFVYFKFSVHSQHFAFCNLRADGNYKPLVYTDFQEFNQGFKVPSEASHDSKFDKNNYDPLYGTLQITLYHESNKRQLNIAVQNTKDLNQSSGTFQVYCSSSAYTTILRIGDKQIESVNPDVQRRRYELSTQTKGTLDIFVVPCLGDFKLEISSNWTLLKQDVPDVQVSRLTDGIIAGSIPNADGRYFITVSALDQKSQNTLIFEMYSTFTKAGEPKIKRLYPGKNGLLSWSSKEDLTVIVNWNPVENEDTTPAKDLRVQYYLYFNKGGYKDMMSSCGLHHFSQQNHSELLGSTFDTFIEVVLPEKKGFINVVAVLPYDNKSPIREIVYDPTEILIAGQPQQTFGLLIFWVLAIALFIAVMLSIYFYKKKETAQKILNYELSDVRNIASVTSIEKGYPKRNESYSALSQSS